MANYNSDYTGAQIDSAVSRANSTDVTAGTVAASKAVVVDSNKDITGFRHITATGTVTAANVSLTGNVDLGDASGDTVTITGSIDSNLIPAADDTYDIGSATYAWQDLFLEGDITLSDAGTIATTAGDLTLNAGSGEIVFGNENLTTTGTIDSGSQAVTGNVVASGTVQAEQLTTTDDLTVSGLATIGETLAVTGVVTAAGFTIGSAVINEAELETIDGITAGTVIASKAIVTDSNIDITGGRNITISGELDAATLDISGNADIDGTLEADAYTVDGTALNEYIADTVGAMVSSNTETNITVSYEDGDNTLDFVIGTLNQDTTGTADNITISANNSSDETVYPIFVDGATGSQGAESDTGLTYNPSSGLLTSTLFAGTLNTAAQGNVTSLGTLTALTVDNIAIDGTTIGHTGDTDLITLTSGVVTVAGEVDATSLDISGDADIDGTLEADAITVDGTTLAEYISDTTGAMVSSNTESGITVTYQDGDNTIDFSVDAAQTGITSLLATDIKIGEDDQTKIDFEDADKINFYAGNEKQLILEDGALYPGSDNIIDLGKSDNEFKDAFFDGTVTADAFAGPITGAVTGNADTATLATTVTVSDSTANTNFPVVFHNESNALLDDTGALRYNPSTGELLVPKLTVAGTTTTVDTVTMKAQNAIVFEGATDDSYETTLSIVDPTADHTQYLVNQGGYIPVLAAATTTAISATPAEINLIDGGTARGTTAVASGDGILINDGGTMRMTNVDTVSTYFSSHNVGGGNIVTTGALNSGSITSGFGTIDTGSSNITTTGVGAFGSLDISGNVDVDGTLEADAITVDSVALATYIRDTVGTNMVSSNTESGITVTYDTSNDNIDFAVDAAQTGITSLLATDIKIGEDDQTKIDFETANEIHFYADNAQRLNIDANSRISLSNNDSGSMNTVFGYNAGANIGSGDNENVFIGHNVGDADMTDAVENVGMGANALTDLTTGDNNIAIGTKSLENLTAGGQNTAIGGYAMYRATTQSDQNVAIGYLAMSGNFTTADVNNCVVIGTDAMTGTLTTNASGSVAIGKQALEDLTDGAGNIAIGYQSAKGITTGTNNTIIGYEALEDADGAEHNNTVIGYNAGKNINDDNADNNVLIGKDAGKAGAAAFTQNVVIGVQALDGTSTAALEGCVVIGYQAGSAIDNTNSNGIVAIGHQAGASATSVTNTTLVGYAAGDALTNGSDNTALGRHALGALTGGGSNVAVGYNALASAADTESGNVAIGNTAMGACDQGSDANADIDANVCIGYNAGYGGDFGSANKDFIRNVVIGYNAMDGSGALDTYDNVFIGYDSGGGSWTTTGSTNNIGIGSYSMDANLNGADNNIGIGSATLTDLTGGNDNVAIGHGAGADITTGNHNVMVGSQSGAEHTTGSRNVAIGYNSFHDTGGSSSPASVNNVAIGFEAMGGAHGTNDSNSNVCIGAYAMDAAMDAADYNAVCGFNSFTELTTGDKNQALGAQVMAAVTSGSGNIGMGYGAGATLVDGSGNIIIGQASDVSATNAANQTAIGYGITCTGDNDIALGNTSVDSIKGQVSFGTYSDVRIKKDITDTNIGLDFINQLKPRKFKRVAPKDYPEEIRNDFEKKHGELKNPDAVVDGMIAQEVKETMDSMGVSFSGWHENDNTKQELQYATFVMPLIKAVQELSAENNDLKSRIEALENK